AGEPVVIGDVLPPPAENGRQRQISWRHLMPIDLQPRSVLRTHTVENQPLPLGAYNAYRCDTALQEAVARGFKRDQNAVTILAALAPHLFSNGLSMTPEGILTTACANMRICAGTGRHPQYALVFAGEHMATMAKTGWTREDVQRYCFEHTRISTAELKRINLKDGAVGPGDETEMQTLVEVPQDFLVIAAGGNAGSQSAYIPGWGSKSGSQSVTREIRRS
ncbi:MAG: hypothetical protein AAB325_01410, partial [Pseudomonadota bacterium]